MFKFHLSINVWIENYIEYLEDTFCLIDLIWPFLSGTCSCLFWYVAKNSSSWLKRIKWKSICLCKYHRISIFIFFIVSTLLNITTAFKKIFSVRHSNNIFLYEPVFLATIFNVIFGTSSWMKIWKLWGISRTG